ncbi:MAG: hypothetical protein AB7W59_10180 [Acidimicrobiia bacterium]
MNLSTLLVLVFLVGMWVALLIGPVLRHRGAGGNRGGDSIKSFQRQLSVLDRSRPGRSAMVRPLASSPAGRSTIGRAPVRPSQSRARMAAQRRKRIVTVLAGSTFTFLVLSFLSGGLFVGLFLVSAALLVSYLALMFHLLGTQAEREMKVAFLPHRDAGAEPTALLHLREASGGRR